MLKPFGRILLIYLKMFVLWMMFFSVARLVFMIFHSGPAGDLALKEWLAVLVIGLKHDLAVSSYCMLPPLALTIVLFFMPFRTFSPIIRIFFLGLTAILCLLVAIDLELYTYWGFRLDASPLLYATHPREMMASVSSWVIIRQLLIAGFLWSLVFLAFQRWVMPVEKYDFKAGWITVPGLLLIIGLLIIPIRGGFGKAPMNVGSVYYFEKQFANHAAVNVVFNLGYSLSHLDAQTNPYVVMDRQLAKTLVDSSLVRSNTLFPMLLNSTRPNILIILLESFTSKAVAAVGGLPGITPHFDSIARNGILFNNLYSSGSRSDRGLVAVISGYPALPTQGIMLYPSKSSGLPFVSRELGKLGYTSSFFYGGDVDFGGMRGYLSTGGFSTIVSLQDFGREAAGTEWGVFDQFVFDSLANYLANQKKPFFTLYFTLTSHEPYILPDNTRPFLAGEDSDTKFLNAIHYTDSCLGVFINRAKEASWWKNTRVILIADHGSEHPGGDGIFDIPRYRIPMVWTGGAVKTDSLISHYASQADLPSTVLAQMELDNSAFTFSRNIFLLTREDGTIFFFNDGFGFVSGKASFTWDNKSRRLLNSTGENVDNCLRYAKAYQQVLVDDFVSR
ncbi:MAG: sulfatase-like hydrolase/transferase [Bacteroidales bacterium]